MKSLSELASLNSFKKRFLFDTVVAFTFDTDNCPQEILLELGEQLHVLGLGGTFFCDNPYQIPFPHETALHPFIKDFSTTKAILEPVRKLLRYHPAASGIRCHQLTANGNLYTHLPSLGLVYESSWPMVGEDKISPIRMLSGLFQFPIYFSDGVFLHSGLDLEAHLLERPGLKVLSFHPVHIWHNSTPDTVDNLLATPYSQRYRPDLKAPGRGIRTIFEEAVEFVLSHQLKCVTLEQLSQELADIYD